MQAVVANIPDFKQQVVGELVLKVECPVLRVREFVVDVVATQQEGAKEVAGRPASRMTAGGLRQVGQQGQETSSGAGRRRRLNSTKRLRETRILLSGDRLNKWRRQRHAEGAVKSGSCAWREVAEKLAAVIVNAVTRAQGQFRERRPGDADARGNAPLALVHQRVAGACNFQTRTRDGIRCCIV